ncbi:cytochrome c1 [Pandoraea pulmonicola]|uniref:Cytochrome C n=1 Tax=Pandoraea pulmonicola TaxID=93221 RepID=A0AAJ4ZDX8_PANPU|nr:cytochrome c1 [Pandoraea pulmonicola]AJC20185.1 cytochrome C [Pandoraea pulmonicola]SUA91480.1 Cytochrome c1 precursor [Pandoraea pulmonicola]
MKKLLLILALLSGFAAPAMAEEGVALDTAPNRIDDLASLQRGAKLFVNYCLNCHSAASMRYSRLKDLGLSEAEIKNNLLFTTDKIGDTMTVAMRVADAKSWFGSAPPDLSVEARARGTDWLYTYLRTFYRDDARPTGWNNLAFPNVGMPNPFWQLQGQRGLKHVEGAEHGPAQFVQITQGTMKPVEFDSAVADLVSYLDWMSEPAQRTRRQLGVWVLLFLGLFTVLAWRLNAAYWKDVK